MMNIDEKIAMSNDILQAALQYKMYLEDNGKEDDFTDTMLAAIATKSAILQKESALETDINKNSLTANINEAFKVIKSAKIKDEVAFERPDKDGVEI